MAELARGVRFPRGEGLHFTLKFLGPTPDGQVEEIREALARAAREVAPFSATLEGLSAFPSPRKPRVVYLDVTEGGAQMERLAAAVERHLAPLGFPTERRRFTPHVTLARVKDFKASPRIGARVAALAPVRVATIEVKDVALMLSQLHPGGSRYTALARLPLGA